MGQITPELIAELRIREKVWQKREHTTSVEYDVVMSCLAPLLDEVERLRAEVAKLEQVRDAAQAYLKEYLHNMPCALRGWKSHRRDCERCALDAALDAAKE